MRQPLRTDRRRFLGLAASPFLCPAIVPASARGADALTAPSNRITMGFIGVGGMGTGHVRAFLDQPGVQVLAVCDVRGAHRDRARQLVESKHGDGSCAVHGDFRALLARDDIDAVCIATPEHWHAPILVLLWRSASAILSRRRISNACSFPAGLLLTVNLLDWRTK